MPSFRRILTITALGALSVAAIVIMMRRSATANDNNGDVLHTASAVESGALSRNPLAVSPGDSMLQARADGDRVLGAANAPVTLLMVSDFECPFCKKWHDESMAELRTDYIEKGQVQFALFHMPLPNHANAFAASEAALCAGAQGESWRYGDALFGAQRELSGNPDPEALFARLALDVKLDTTAFQDCMRRHIMRPLIMADLNEAQRAQVRATPTFVIGPFRVDGAAPWPDFRRAIDSALVLAGSRD